MYLCKKTLRTLRKVKSDDVLFSHQPQQVSSKHPFHSCHRKTDSVLNRYRFAQPDTAIGRFSVVRRGFDVASVSGIAIIGVPPQKLLPQN